jgi:fatty acid-binding protein DegV
VDSLDKLNAIWSAIERCQEEGIRVLDNEVELLLQEIRKREQLLSKSLSKTSTTTTSPTSSSEEERAWTADELHLLSRALVFFSLIH